MERISTKGACVNASFKGEKEDQNAKLSFDLSLRAYTCVAVMKNFPKAMDNMNRLSKFKYICFNEIEHWEIEDVPLGVSLFGWI